MRLSVNETERTMRRPMQIVIRGKHASATVRCVWGGCGFKHYEIDWHGDTSCSYIGNVKWSGYSPAITIDHIRESLAYNDRKADEALAQIAKYEARAVAFYARRSAAIAKATGEQA